MVQENRYPIILSEVVGIFFVYLGLRMVWDTITGEPLQAVFTLLFTNSTTVMKLYVLVGVILILIPFLKILFGTGTRTIFTCSIILIILGIFVESPLNKAAYFGVGALGIFYGFWTRD